MGEAGPELHRGADPGRDQSYFLFGTTAEQLDFLRFPAGRPAQERDARAGRALRACRSPTSPTARTSASCPTATMPRGAEAAAGGGRAGRDRRPCRAACVGRHDGIVRFTVGQRRGLALGDRDGTDNEPLYVVRLEPESAPRRRRPALGARPQRDRALRRELARPARRRRAAGAGPRALVAGAAAGRDRASRPTGPGRSDGALRRARGRRLAGPGLRRSTMPTAAAACWAEDSSARSA